MGFERTKGISYTQWRSTALAVTFIARRRVASRGLHANPHHTVLQVCHHLDSVRDTTLREAPTLVRAHQAYTPSRPHHIHGALLWTHPTTFPPPLSWLWLATRTAISVATLNTLPRTANPHHWPTSHLLTWAFPDTIMAVTLFCPSPSLPQVSKPGQLSEPEGNRNSSTQQRSPHRSPQRSTQRQRIPRRDQGRSREDRPRRSNSLNDSRRRSRSPIGNGRGVQ